MTERQTVPMIESVQGDATRRQLGHSSAGSGEALLTTKEETERTSIVKCTSSSEEKTGTDDSTDRDHGDVSGLETGGEKMTGQTFGLSGDKNWKDIPSLEASLVHSSSGAEDTLLVDSLNVGGGIGLKLGSRRRTLGLVVLLVFVVLHGRHGSGGGGLYERETGREGVSKARTRQREEKTRQREGECSQVGVGDGGGGGWCEEEEKRGKSAQAAF